MKIYFTILFFSFFILTKAQNDCPAGYEIKSIKCNGKMTSKCVPVNYTCNKCWTLEFAPCPGRTNGGQGGYSSYEKAEIGAKRESNNWHDGKCTWYDNTKYEIYLDASEFCDQTPPLISTDLKSRLKILKDQWTSAVKKSIKIYLGISSGKNSGSVGDVIKEYRENIELSEKRIKELELFINNYDGKKIDEINEELKNFENDYSNFQTISQSYETKFSEAEEPINTWIKLPDGYSYKIAQNGYYSFFDGYDVVESYNAADGKAELLKHQNQPASSKKDVNNNSSNNSYGSSEKTNAKSVNYTDNDAVKNLQNLYNVLSSQINELKKDGITPEIQELEKQLEKLRLEIIELQKEN